MRSVSGPYIGLLLQPARCGLFSQAEIAFGPAGCRGAEKGERVEKHLLLTRYDPIRAERGEMLKVDDVLEILSIPLLGIVPESQEVLRASNLGQPVTLSNAASPPARAYADAVRRLKGETLAMSVPSDKKSFFGTLFRRAA